MFSPKIRCEKHGFAFQKLVESSESRETVGLSGDITRKGERGGGGGGRRRGGRRRGGRRRGMMMGRRRGMVVRRGRGRMMGRIEIERAKTEF